MMAWVIIIGAWSPQSAWDIGERHGMRVSSGVETSFAGDRLKYSNDLQLFGQPTLAYHRGTEVGFELSLGARFTVGYLTFGGTPLLIGLKQTIVKNDTFAFALQLQACPFEALVEQGLLSWLRPEAIASVSVSKRWSLDFGLGAMWRGFWAKNGFNQAGPRARAGATLDSGKHVFFTSLEFGTDINFVGPRPAPFPYALVDRHTFSVTFGYARH